VVIFVVVVVVVEIDKKLLGRLILVICTESCLVHEADSLSNS